jgi:hypothetical protein
MTVSDREELVAGVLLVALALGGARRRAELGGASR